MRVKFRQYQNFSSTVAGITTGKVAIRGALVFVIFKWTLGIFWITKFSDNVILLHSGLYPAWHFWLSTRFYGCLKMKSVENILGYIREQFYRSSRGCKPRENLWNCSRKYLKIFETYFIFRQQKIEFKPMSGVIMLLCNRIFCWIFGQFFWARLLVGTHF